MDRFTYRSETVYTASRPASGGARDDHLPGGLPGTAPSGSLPLSPAGARSQLRHPGMQHELHELRAPQQQRQQTSDRPVDPQAHRVVSVLLRELDATRKQGAAAAELAAVKQEYLCTLRQDKKGCADVATDASKLQAKAAAGPVRRQPAAGGSSGAPGTAPTHIRAFRPPGQAPPSRPPQQQKQQQKHRQHPSGRHQPQDPLNRVAAPAPNSGANAGGNAHRQEEELQVLHNDNAEMRAHLEALYVDCSHLQKQLDAAAIFPQRTGLPRRPLSAAAAAATAAPASSPGRPRSPCRTTVVVASPRAGGGAAELSVAVFEPAPEDTDALRLALNRLQRQNLKLSSKLDKSQSELESRSVEARRWQEAVEQQAGTIAPLRVEVESERRRQRDLEHALAAAEVEQAAAQQDTSAMLEQLRAAEAAACAAEGEAGSLRGRLAVAEEQLDRVLREAEHLKEEATCTNARLSATDVVRREAERERDSLELTAQQLRAALAEAQASGCMFEEEIAAQLSAAQQQVAVEQQRSAMLQAQLSLAEAQGRETERVLTDQLQAVQEERNVCLAAATRADALLVKLGQHAMATRGSAGGGSGPHGGCGPDRDR